MRIVAPSTCIEPPTECGMRVFIVSHVSRQTFHIQVPRFQDLRRRDTVPSELGGHEQAQSLQPHTQQFALQHQPGVEMISGLHQRVNKQVLARAAHILSSDINEGLDCFFAVFRGKERDLVLKLPRAKTFSRFSNISHSSHPYETNNTLSISLDIRLSSTRSLERTAFHEVSLGMGTFLYEARYSRLYLICEGFEVTGKWEHIFLSNLSASFFSSATLFTRIFQYESSMSRNASVSATVVLSCSSSPIAFFQAGS